MKLQFFSVGGENVNIDAANSHISNHALTQPENKFNAEKEKRRNLWLKYHLPGSPTSPSALPGPMI